MNPFSDIFSNTYCTNEGYKKSESDLNLKVICGQTGHFVAHSSMGNSQLTAYI